MMLKLVYYRENKFNIRNIALYRVYYCENYILIFCSDLDLVLVCSLDFSTSL